MSAETPPRPPVGRLWHVALRVADLPRTERFYVDLLGFYVEWRPDEDNVYLTTGRDNLALHRDEGARGAPPETRLGHLGLCVAQMAEVDDWAAFLRAQGVTLETEPRTHRDGARSFYFRDPEGTLIQLLCHPPLREHV
jgi:catechol 2,3-dioxygenase-like lactoylglutathione lyase family enzyme